MLTKLLLAKEDLSGRAGIVRVGTAALKLVAALVGLYIALNLSTDLFGAMGTDTASFQHQISLAFNLSLALLCTVASVGATRAMRRYSATHSDAIKWWMAELALSMGGAVVVALTLLKGGYWWIVPAAGFLFVRWWIENQRDCRYLKQNPEALEERAIDEAAMQRQAQGVSQEEQNPLNSEEETEDAPPPEREPIDALLDELDSYVGLDRVKEEVRDLVSGIRVEQQRVEAGLSSEKPSGHVRFLGNPGTGKTTIARLVGRIYHALGLLEKGHVVEAQRSDLVGEHIGNTAIKTNMLIDRAQGGILFIDEAHDLYNGSASAEDPFGKEAIGALVKRMEDDRDRLVVIIAGYPVEIERFLDSNPGLSSRFGRALHFEDYSAEQLHQIAINFFVDSQRQLTDDARTLLLDRIRELHARRNARNWGNGREARRLFEAIKQAQNRRLGEYPVTDLSGDELRARLMEITADDVAIGVELFGSQGKAAKLGSGVLLPGA